MLAYREYRESLCPGCGHPKRETFAPGPPYYEADGWECRACKVRDRTVNEFRKDNADMAGVYFEVHEVDTAAPPRVVLPGGEVLTPDD